LGQNIKLTALKVRDLGISRLSQKMGQVGFQKWDKVGQEFFL